MQKQNKDEKPTRVNRLKQIYYNLGQSVLCYCLTRSKYEFLAFYYDATTDDERAELEREIPALAESLGIDHEEMYYGDMFVESIKRLGGTHKGNARARRIYDLLVEIEARADKLIDARRRVGTPAARPDAQGEAKGAHFRVDLAGSWGAENIGYVDGEMLLCEDDPSGLKVGDAAAAWYEGESASVGRVVAADSRTFTIRRAEDDEYTEKTYERAHVVRAGRVIGTTHRHDAATEARLTTLRATLESLAREDDQIIRCSERYRIEREIYDIEHPPAGLNDWSEWEEDEKDE